MFMKKKKEQPIKVLWRNLFLTKLGHKTSKINFIRELVRGNKFLSVDENKTWPQIFLSMSTKMKYIYY